jgi:hypothetical protein
MTTRLMYTHIVHSINIYTYGLVCGYSGCCTYTHIIVFMGITYSVSDMAIACLLTITLFITINVMEGSII